MRSRSINDFYMGLSEEQLLAWSKSLEENKDNKTDCAVILSFEDFRGNKTTLITDMRLNLDDCVEKQICSVYPNVLDFKWVEKEKLE